jgi:hypothetical protein
LVESWSGSGDGERRETERGKEVTSPYRKEGLDRPLQEVDRLLQEEEEKAKKSGDWKAIEGTVLDQRGKEDRVQGQGIGGVPALQPNIPPVLPLQPHHG